MLCTHCARMTVYQRRRPKYYTAHSRIGGTTYSRYMMQVCNPGSRILGGSLDLSMPLCMLRRRLDWLVSMERKFTIMPATCRQIEFTPACCKDGRCDTKANTAGPTCGLAREVLYLLCTTAPSSSRSSRSSRSSG